MTTIQHKKVYPHRLSLFNKGFCDVCGDKESKRNLSVRKHDYVGFNVCNDENCNLVSQIWLEEKTISNKNLRKEIGDIFYVKRTNGRKESGWEIRGDSYQEFEDGPYWVLVSKKSKSKCITLEMLRKWNNI